MLEAVASYDLWIWHAFFGVAGANNDITVLNNFPLFDDLLDDIAPVAPFEVNGVTFQQGYYLADGIYPQWSSFVKSFLIKNSKKNAMIKEKIKNTKGVRLRGLEESKECLQEVRNIKAKGRFEDEDEDKDEE
ncbi:ALP1-like protein [Tanacetum coccineum]